MGQERLHIADFFLIAQPMGGEGNKQHGDMGDRAVVLCCCQADHGGSLHGDRQETREDTLHGSPLIVDEFKSFSSVGDLVTNGGGQADQIVAAFLTEELGMRCWAEKILPAIFLAPESMQRIKMRLSRKSSFLTGRFIGPKKHQ